MECFRLLLDHLAWIEHQILSVVRDSRKAGSLWRMIAVPHPPYSPDLVPCDFWLFPKARGCRYATIEEIKEAVTKVIDMLTQGKFLEVVGTVQQEHCSRRRLLRRELEFHRCNIHKCAHTKKKSGNLSYAPRIFNNTCQTINAIHEMLWLNLLSKLVNRTFVSWVIDGNKYLMSL